MTTSIRSIKVLAIAVAVLCAIAFMPLLCDSMQSHAATKLKVSKTSVTVTAGKSVKVTANKKKATWKSGKTTIANLTKTKGKVVYIQGIKKGTTTVTVKFGKQTKKIKVTVKAAPKPATPPKNDTVNPNKYVKEGDISVTGYYQGDATVYSLLYQESAEVAALQMQAFSLAKIRLDDAIKANHDTGDGLAIVTDIDSTIADDTCYIAGAVLDTSGRMGVEYFGNMLEPWVNDDWCGYYQAVATTADTAIPGAKQFVDYAYSKGVEWYYITNRPYYELDLTVQQLWHQGFLEKAPDANGNKIPDLVEAFDTAKKYHNYLYYGDTALAGALDEDGYYAYPAGTDEAGKVLYEDGTYAKEINDDAEAGLEIQPGSFSVKGDYRVQVQGTDFDSDKTARRANVAEKVGRDNIVMYMGDSINDMVSDAEKKVWSETNPNSEAVRAKDFTRKQYNDTRTANASDPYWAGDWGTGQSVGEGSAYNPGHWGYDFIVLPNATYGDWYKATWAKGSKDKETGISSKTLEGQQQYIYNQIWNHSYLNTDIFKTWYTDSCENGHNHNPASPVTPDVQ